MGMTTRIDDTVTILEPNECWQLLRTTEVGRLAVVVEDRPDIFPINFLVDHGTIVFRTAEGTKLASLSSDGMVAFEADGYDGDIRSAWSVVIKGRADEITRMHDLVETTTLPLFPWHSAPKAHFVRVVPDQISGRRFSVGDATAWLTPLTNARHVSAE